MAFNIDSDPINANWLRWKSWSVPCQSLPELIEYLRISEASREIQVKQLMRLNRYYTNAPELLNYQLREFLSGVPLENITTELRGR